jgi:hypothetical protein
MMRLARIVCVASPLDGSVRSLPRPRKNRPSLIERIADRACLENPSGIRGKNRRRAILVDRDLALRYVLGPKHLLLDWLDRQRCPLLRGWKEHASLGLRQKFALPDIASLITAKAYYSVAATTPTRTSIRSRVMKRAFFWSECLSIGSSNLTSTRTTQLILGAFP